MPSKFEFVRQIFLSSCSLVIIDHVTQKRIGYGTGFFISKDNQNYFITAGHVVDSENCSVLIDTYNPDFNRMGSYFIEIKDVSFIRDYYYRPDVTPLQNLLDIINKNKGVETGQIDLGYHQINEPLNIVKPTIIVDDFKIESSNQIILKYVSDYIPSTEKIYGFSGNIKHDFNGVKITSEKKVVLDLEFDHTCGNLHYFNYSKVIKDESELQGCSGAPVFDNDGNFIGIFTSFFLGTKTIMVLSSKALFSNIDKIKQIA